MFTDSNSSVYEIETNDVCEDFHLNKDMFDFSEYHDNSRFCDLTNKKAIGKMKDETKSVAIVECVLFLLNWSLRWLIRQKKKKQLIITLLKIWHIKSKQIHFLERNKWGVNGKEYKVNLVNQLKLTKFLYHVLMINDTYMMMELKLYEMDIKILISCFDWAD